MKNYKLYDITMALFVAVLIISNIASSKIVTLGAFQFDGGTILFPLAYIFGDLLTEVYGFKASRRIIWTGFFCLGLMSFVLWIVGKMPYPAEWTLQSSYESLLMATPRIAGASLIAYLFGEFSNSTVMAKMKVLTKGKYVWARTISSTLVGELLDTVIFTVIAFYGVFSNDLLITIMISNYIFKVLFEVVLTPVTLKVIKIYKNVEQEDVYDDNCNIIPTF